MVTAEPRPLMVKSYKGVYPSAADYLIEAGVCSRPRQYERIVAWAYGVDIEYTLYKMTPANFYEYYPSLLLLAYQEARRYDEFQYKFAGFEVKLYLTKKGKERRLAKRGKEEEVGKATYQAAMHKDADIMVYGEEALGYEVPQQYYLVNRVRAILEITQRYPEGVRKQVPYRVTKLFISIRERK